MQLQEESWKRCKKKHCSVTQTEKSCIFLKAAAFSQDLKRGRIWIPGMFIILRGCVLDLFLKSSEKEPDFSVFEAMLSYNPKSLSCFILNFISNYKVLLKYLIAFFFLPHILQISARKTLFSLYFGSGISPNFHHALNYK